MAHKKGAGSTDNGRDSHSKRLGVKMFGGERAIAGNIIVRQRGTKYHPGENVYMGRDHTLHAGIDGLVTFKRTKNDRNYVSVLPADLVVAPVAETPVAKKPTVEKAAPAAKPMPAPVEMAPLADEELAADTMPETADTTTPVAEEEPVTAAAPEKAAAPAAKSPKLNDLKIVEGIGPKIEKMLQDGGISTWEELADAPVDRLREILDAAGPRYQIHDPGTWPAQSKFAAQGQWEELKEYQDMLTSGRDVAE